MKTLSFSLVALVLAAACGKSEPEPKAVANAERPSCASAADCVVTTFSNCCACCEAAPHAMLRSEHDRQQGQCAVLECAKACKEDLECPKNERLDSFAAVCKAGTCAAVKKERP